MVTTLLFLCSLTLAFAGPLAAQNAFEQPTDPRSRMKELDEAVVKKQQELFAARQRGNEEETKRLSEEFSEIQKERRDIVQNFGHLL
jgi:hypothetical protein